MSSLPHTITAFVGAAVLGVVGAAAVYVVEHYRQEKRRHTMAQDLARIDTELSLVRRELQKLMTQQQNGKNLKSKRVKRSTKANSTISSTTSEFVSAIDADSSDLEFYDVSDEELEQSTSNNSEQRFQFIIPAMHFQPVNLSYTKPNILKKYQLLNMLNEIDNNLNTSTNLEESLEKLENLCIEQPENPQLLWRIGKCRHKIAELLKDLGAKKEHIEKGIAACRASINLDSDQAEAHKWLAILVGSRSDFQPMKERIQDGQLFKHHVDIAISINPNDASLHHLVGRFCFEVAGLKWYERKVAATLYADPPKATYEEALEHFLEADKLADYEWKENQLCTAKCYIAMGKCKEAVEWLDKADKVVESNSEDDKIDQEVKTLLNKYSDYR